jgi:hypothetical protein
MGRQGEMILGFAIIVLIVGGGIYGIDRLIKALSPSQEPVQPSLSAYFDGNNLTIKGAALEGSQPLTKGKVLLRVLNLRGRFKQSVFVDLKSDGTFATSATDNPAFGVLRPTDPIQISAEVRPAKTSQAYAETIYLNADAPTPLTRPAIAGLVISGAAFLTLVAVFFWAFTGPPSLTKDRAAIILSYCLLIVFLALPIGSGILLGSGLGPDSMYSAVGLIVTRIPLRDGTQSTDAQWAFNIGGFVSPLPDTSQGAGQPTKNAPASGATTPVGNVTNQAPANTTGQPTTDATQAKTAVAQTSIVDHPTGTSQTLHPWQAQEVHVDGGLVIPLYVIILSVIGGAINMTRKVPTIQGQAPEEYPSVVKRIKSYFQRADEGSETTVKTAIEVTEKTKLPAPDSEMPAPQREPGQVLEHNPATNAIAKQNVAAGQSGGEAGKLDRIKTQHWRVDLLSLYMYLLSAPFLAVVTYYLLWWLDLTKVPILVLVSFSIGLISDEIVKKILSVVQGALNSTGSEDAKQKPANP